MADPLYAGQNRCSDTLHALRNYGFHVDGALDTACTNPNLLALRRRGDTGLPGAEANVFAARDPSRARPSCARWFGMCGAPTTAELSHQPRPQTAPRTTVDGFAEMEDLWTAGLPGQLPMCVGEQRCPVCREPWYGGGKCFFYWSEAACSCDGFSMLTAGGRDESARIWGGRERAFGEGPEVRAQRESACEGEGRAPELVAECKRVA